MLLDKIHGRGINYKYGETKSPVKYVVGNMIVLSRRPPGLHIKQVWFAEQPEEVDDCDIVQFYYCRKDIEMDGFTKHPVCSIVVDLSQGEEKVWSNISRNMRTGIRKAMDEGIVVIHNEDSAEFLELNKKFRAEKEILAINYPPEFVKEHCQLWTVRKDGELMVGLLMLVDAPHMLGLLAASKRLEADKGEAAYIANCNKLVWWEAIKYGLANGVEDFDMGGYDDVPDKNAPVSGVSEFKRRFGGEVVHYLNYEKVYTLKAKLGKGTMKYLGGFRRYLYNRDW